MRKIFVVVILLIGVIANAQKMDSCSYYRKKSDTLSQQNYILKSQISWVRYYLSLMERRPKDTVYARGWLLRAISSKLPPSNQVNKKK